MSRNEVTTPPGRRERHDSLAQERQALSDLKDMGVTTGSRVMSDGIAYEVSIGLDNKVSLRPLDEGGLPMKDGMTVVDLLYKVRPGGSLKILPPEKYGQGFAPVEGSYVEYDSYYTAFYGALQQMGFRLIPQEILGEVGRDWHGLLAPENTPDGTIVTVVEIELDTTADGRLPEGKRVRTVFAKEGNASKQRVEIYDRLLQTFGIHSFITMVGPLQFGSTPFKGLFVREGVFVVREGRYSKVD